MLRLCFDSESLYMRFLRRLLLKVLLQVEVLRRAWSCPTPTAMLVGRRRLTYPASQLRQQALLKSMGRNEKSQRSDRRRRRTALAVIAPVRRSLVMAPVQSSLVTAPVRRSLTWPRLASARGRRRDRSRRPAMDLLKRCRRARRREGQVALRRIRKCLFTLVISAGSRQRHQ